MSSSVNVVADFARAREAYRDAAQHREKQDSLKSGGGGGNFDDMEPRVARLEEDLKELKADMKAVRGDLQYLRGKVDSLPNSLQLLGFAVAVFVAAGVFRFFGH